MKIVVTDGFTLNPGDLSWAPVEKLGELIIYDRMPAHTIVEHCKDAEVVLTNKVPFTAETLQQLPLLKFIGVTATGYNVIDIEAAKKQGIIVCNVPAYGTASVAQHTFALLLELTNRVGVHATSVASGEWVAAKDWCYTKFPLTELDGKTIGIVGLGNIGQQTAKIAKAFGMQVLYTGRNKKDTDLGEFTDMNTLFAQSDVVSLHLPLTNENNQFVNRDLLQLMKPSSFLINTSRGPLINEHDLADALNEGRIAGAAVDVLSVEPPKDTNPLLKAKNCIITPHNAWMSREARQRVMDITAKNLEAFLSGRPINIV
ncbi:D-2-hydroxyacid dehydrogenase [Chitinophagaceae bacterium LB-8]|uniref:D-2-hydroxyacid dehydrogenase n=1 Tax=Paraflavisolibacter caeni TaxID=2982496 RepID=A0A9X2XSX0_9BACT|nr:D-2-hydroxyacid dehydrogenase [Paraflavisolibacter caeni]MCU7547682.1 D-2-hydroxyacid dehydrogenase [Paraflavisolibacter caeni]